MGTFAQMPSGCMLCLFRFGPSRRRIRGSVSPLCFDQEPRRLFATYISGPVKVLGRNYSSDQIIDFGAPGSQRISGPRSLTQRHPTIEEPGRHWLACGCGSVGRQPIVPRRLENNTEKGPTGQTQQPHGLNVFHFFKRYPNFRSKNGSFL